MYMENVVRKHQHVILCEDYAQLFHLKCIDLPMNEYDRLSAYADRLL